MKRNTKRMAPAAKPPAEPEPIQTSEPLPVTGSADNEDAECPAACSEPLFRAFDHVGGGRIDFLRDVEHLRIGLHHLMRMMAKPTLATSLLLQGLTIQEHLRSTDWHPSQCLSMTGPLWAEVEVFFVLVGDALLALGGQPRFASATLAAIAVSDHLKSLCYAKEQTQP